MTLRSWRLTPAQLALRGLHPCLGPATLRQLIATWVAHDQGHVAQIARVQAKQLREEVGPWAAYLPVLHDREPSGGRGSAHAETPRTGRTG